VAVYLSYDDAFTSYNDGDVTYDGIRTGRGKGYGGAEADERKKQTIRRLLAMEMAREMEEFQLSCVDTEHAVAVADRRAEWDQEIKRRQKVVSAATYAVLFSEL